jgi:hypothetical protein
MIETESHEHLDPVKGTKGKRRENYIQLANVSQELF